MTAIPFPLRSNPAPFKFMGEARLINAFAEEIGPENKTPVAIIPIPGQATFASFVETASRGMLPVPELETLFTVHSSTLYMVDENGDETAIDGIVAGSSPVIMERGPARFMQADVTISIASPAVIGWTNHNLPADTPVQFATTGSLPTGLEAGKTYYVIASGLTNNSFEISETVGGSAVNTTGGQSGTQTAIRGEATYQVVIVSDEVTYCIEDGHLFFVDLPEPAVSVTYLSGRWIYAAASGRFYYSALNDARSVDALSYATAEARPDGLVRGLADRGELWLFGDATTEVYTPSDDADAPFIPLGGSFIDKGCASKMTVVSFDNAPHWLGHDGVVYRGQGYNAERVSTHPVERAIAAITDKTTIRAYTYLQDGHAFYVLTCPDWTWVFDAATKTWHERKSYSRNDWLAWPYASAFGKHLVGDKASGAIRELKSDTWTENGQPIRVELILPDIPGENIFNRLEIDVATGVGLSVASTTLGYDPKVMLSWSDDGGYTWSSERIESIGKQGEYHRTVAFTRMGKSKKKGRRYRIAMTDPVIKAFALGDIKAEQVA
jgi:hypothetical protein